MRYVVRPRQSAHAKQGSGTEGGGGTVIYAESAAKARELGAAQLGTTNVEVFEMEDAPPVFGEDRPLTREEAEEIYNQDTQIVSGSWEH